jgi:hypothetical protein
MSFANQIIKSRANTVCLIIAPVVDDRIAWYFIRVEPIKFDKFKIDVFNAATNLASYGEVLRRGFGKYPPQSVINEMQQEYGFNPQE